MSLAECQINPIDVNFHLQKSLEIFDKIQLTKSDPKRTMVIKVKKQNWSKVLTLGFLQDFFVLMMNLGGAGSFRKVDNAKMFLFFLKKAKQTALDWFCKLQLLLVLARRSK